GLFLLSAPDDQGPFRCESGRVADERWPEAGLAPRRCHAAYRSAKSRWLMAERNRTMVGEGSKPGDSLRGAHAGDHPPGDVTESKLPVQPAGYPVIRNTLNPAIVEDQRHIPAGVHAEMFPPGEGHLPTKVPR